MEARYLAAVYATAGAVGLGCGLVGVGFAVVGAVVGLGGGAVGGRKSVGIGRSACDNHAVGGGAQRSGAAVGCAGRRGRDGVVGWYVAVGGRVRCVGLMAGFGEIVVEDGSDVAGFVGLSRFACLVGSG